MPDRNKELFYKVAAKVEAEPTAYNQIQWIEHPEVTGEKPPEDDHLCGTRGCIAGWTTMLCGLVDMKWVTAGRTEDGEILWSPVWVSNQNIFRHDGSLMVRYNTEVMEWSTIAADRLGLADVEAGVLFNGDWSYGGIAESVADALRKIGDGARISEVTLSSYSLERRLHMLRGYENGDRDEEGDLIIPEAEDIY